MFSNLVSNSVSDCRLGQTGKCIDVGFQRSFVLKTCAKIKMVSQR